MSPYQLGLVFDLLLDSCFFENKFMSQPFNHALHTPTARLLLRLSGPAPTIALLVLPEDYNNDFNGFIATLVHGLGWIVEE